MNQTSKRWAWVLVLTAGLAASLAAQTESGNGQALTGGAEFDFNSRYIWRALAWSQGAAWQPSVWLGRSGFELSVWTNFPLGDEPTKRKFNEIDLRLSFTKEWGHFTLAPAFNVYSYPNQDKEENPTTGEFELLASYAFAPFTISTTHYFDVWDNAGGYIGEVALEFEEAPADGWTFEAAARLSLGNAKFHGYYVPIEKAALSALVFEVGLTYALSSTVYLRPHAEWTTLLDGEVKKAVAASPWVFSGKASLLNFGLALGLAF